MKKQLTFFVLVILIWLTACSTEKKDQVDIDHYAYSSEKIEVIQLGENGPLEEITDPEAIENFVEILKVDMWEIGEIPVGLVEGTMYKFYDRETAKFGESVEDKALVETASITVYSSEPYIEFTTKYFNFGFKVPVEVQEDLLK